MDTVRQVIETAYASHEQERPIIVAIDGLSGAGKTTLVNQLRGIVPNEMIFHIDDFIVERSRRYDTGEPEAIEYYTLQWDVDLLVETLFKPLQEGQATLTLPYYDRDRDEVINRTVEIAPTAIVLIEGIFLLRDEWRAYFDYVVYLDCPQEVRYERVLNRDTYIGDLSERLDKYERRYWPGETHYLKTVNPKAKADHIIRSS
ncbi:kinase [Exiguobacterium aurantiacum]|uniref:Kinase n=1 Tax=Exiguobacterium aurantiacum TaxID=33987 RepID=A0ABY5FLU5_9BACL|nr:kinase [Exiguobacterium aurantiacum]UTT42360.1 kinase [Exiguobacterium aurantiacum]